LAFSEIWLKKVDEDRTILDRSIWSDEATFNLSGTVNRHNAVYWSSENPRQFLVKHMKSPSVTVLAAVSSRGLIGPFFFPATVTGKSFLKVMDEEMIPKVREVYLDAEVFMQMDGAPGHWAKDVRTFMDSKFPNKWIGRGGPIPWPPRSPDLTPPDFFLWGFIKDKVYSKSPSSLDELKDGIKIAFTEVPVAMCERVCRSVESRLQRCIESDGAQIQ